MDWVIHNGSVVTPQGVIHADVGIKSERIAAVTPHVQAQQVIDASGCYVFPGFVDAHVHLQMIVDGLMTGDDFYTGTVAAACGGTTTVMDFTENVRNEDLVEAAGRRRSEAEGQVAVDYALHLTLPDASRRTLQQLRELSKDGYASVKLYTTYEGVRLEDAEILEVLDAVRESGLLPMVHAENNAAIQFLTTRFLTQGRTAPSYHPLSRPPLVEAEAAQRVAALANVVGSPLYLAHVTCRETLQAMARARDRRQIIYGETCPHYLLLSQAEYERPGFEGAKYVLSPPLRDRSNWETLWKALACGDLQVVSTDHCPWNYSTQKVRGKDDFSRIPNGAPGIETRVALLFTEGVAKGRLSLERFVELNASEPARLFGLYPRKGVIAVGSDADLVIFDPNHETSVSAANLHQRVDYSPFEGWTVQGRVRDVLLRGQPVVANGQFVGAAGQGQYVPAYPPGLW